MGFFDEIKKLSKPYGEDDDYDDDGYDDEEDEPRPRTRSRRPASSTPVYDYEELGISGGGAGVVSAPSPGDQRGKVLNLSNAASTPLPQRYQVVIVTPERFDAVTEIAESLRAKNAVLLNLEGASQDVARRLVDFLSGCAFALDGKIKKVASRAYLITPFNVDIAGDLMDELQRSGMSFEPPAT